MDVVPCIRLPGLPDEQRPAYIAADKSLAGHAGRDGLKKAMTPTKSSGVGHHTTPVGRVIGGAILGQGSGVVVLSRAA